MLRAVVGAFSYNPNETNANTISPMLGYVRRALELAQQIKYEDAAGILNTAAVVFVEVTAARYLHKFCCRHCLPRIVGAVAIAYAVGGNDLAQKTGESREAVYCRRAINAAAMTALVYFVRLPRE